MSNPTPTTEQIETLRDLFFKKIEKEGAPCEGGFHPNDIERAKTNDRWIQLFLEQCELDMKQALGMLWSACTWRKTYGTNEISENNIRMDYMDAGIIYPHNKDIDGKTLLIFRSKSHTKGSRDVGEMIRCLVYWIERLHREENYNQITILFDMQSAGLSNMDMDFTKRIIDTFKLYYPNSLNYIIIFEMPWILNAAFKIIKALLPPKAVQIMKFVNTKTMKEVVTEDNMLKAWGGNDAYEFVFVPEEKPANAAVTAGSEALHQNGTSALHLNGATPGSAKKVHFETPSAPESPMSEIAATNFGEKGGDGEMLSIKPEDMILFVKSSNELVGTVNITNIAHTPVTYKIKTTSPKKFRVRPSTGVLAPGANTSITVVLQQGEELSSSPPSKDKFLVMSMELSNDIATNTQAIADLWKNMPSNSSLVELHRLKCCLPQLGALGENVKNGRLNGNGGFPMDATDRQISHFSSTLCQLNETTQRLESQVKFTQTLQWITLGACLLLSMAIVYILKQEINNLGSSPSDFSKHSDEL